MTVKTMSPTTRKTKMIRNIACTAAIASAALLPLVLPTAASALTVTYSFSDTGGNTSGTVTGTISGLVEGDNPVGSPVTVTVDSSPFGVGSLGTYTFIGQFTSAPIFTVTNGQLTSSDWMGLLGNFELYLGASGIGVQLFDGFTGNSVTDAPPTTFSSSPVAVPFAFNPLLGLGAAGAVKAGRKLGDRLRNQKVKATVS